LELQLRFTWKTEVWVNLTRNDSDNKMDTHLLGPSCTKNNTKFCFQAGHSSLSQWYASRTNELR